MSKVVIITGSSSGIGEVCADFLLSKGYIVYGLSRTKPKNENINFLKCDVTNQEEAIDVINRIYALEGRIDVLINNAGMGISGAFELTKAEEIDKIINVNLRGVINLSQATIPYLRESKGKIINIGSVAGEFVIPFQSFYSITKAGVAVLSESLRLELKPFGIKVTCVMPGDTKTKFTANREKNEETGSIYGERIKKSVAQMERDEQKGKSPISVAKVIYKVIKKKNPAPKITVGFSYKLLVFLKRILPLKVIHFILYRKYGK